MTIIKYPQLEKIPYFWSEPDQTLVAYTEKRRSGSQPSSACTLLAPAKPGVKVTARSLWAIFVVVLSYHIPSQRKLIEKVVYYLIKGKILYLQKSILV